MMRFLRLPTPYLGSQFLKLKPKRECEAYYKLIKSMTAIDLPASTTKNLCTSHDLSKYCFWKERYSANKRNERKFDWFIQSHKIYPYIEFHIKNISKRESQQVIKYAELGCGMSELPLVTFKESKVALQLILTDFVLEALQHQTSFFQGVAPGNESSSSHFVCADILNLPLKDGSQDIIVDKGTMDALLKDRREGHGKSQDMFSEVMRVLSVGGRYVQVTDEDPDSRLLLLENFLNVVKKNVNNLSPLSQPSSHDSHPRISSLSHFEREERETDRIVGSNSHFVSKRDLKHLEKCSWFFKTITDDFSDKEYFMYWCDKL